MSQTRLTLVSHKLCAFVQRAAIVLLEKNAPFERVDIDLSAKPNWFSALSPTGKVPVLQVQREGTTAVALFESMPICEYLDETLGGPRLHAEDPLIRAQQRAWIEFGTAILMDAWAFLTATDNETATAKGATVRSKLIRLEEALGGSPYFEGRRFTMVDAVYAPVFRWFDALSQSDFGAIFNHLPKVGGWRNALRERVSVQKAVASDFAVQFRDHLQASGALLMQ